MPQTEKVQIYAVYTDSRTETPIRQLCGVKAVPMDEGEIVTTKITIDKYWTSAVLDDGRRVAPDGGIRLYYAKSDSFTSALEFTEILK